MKAYLQTIFPLKRRPLKIILLALAGYGVTRLHEVSDLVSQELCLWVSAVYMVIVMPNRLYTAVMWAGILSLFYWAQW
ncbi:hypothetical protein DYU11_27440 [Fibrisoma montanum]|uniref:Histidine kinase n=1 Tax=Fibrisoma montanum TaxID=2305895 RepID=A0A418LZB0_9BACT|nr:hypothetical protein DYU11_27440 [Fibrisoma montanum]